MMILQLLPTPQTTQPQQQPINYPPNNLDNIVLQNPKDASDIKIVNAQTSDVSEAMSLMANVATDVILSNPEFQIKVENFVDLQIAFSFLTKARCQSPL